LMALFFLAVVFADRFIPRADFIVYNPDRLL
jgi:hypothetical protein